MTATNVGILYSIAQKRRRAVIKPDNDAQLNDPAWIQQGVGMLQLPLGQYNTMSSLQDLDTWIAGQLGGAASSDRCALVDSKSLLVTSIIKADPAIDTVPNTVIIQHNLANPGDRLNGAVIERQYAQVDITNTVKALVWVDVTRAGPIAANIGGRVVPTTTATVGVVIPPVAAHILNSVTASI